MDALTGAFALADTHGLSLEIILLELRDREMVVAWDDFVSDARKHGWSDKTIRKKILGAWGDAFGSVPGEFEERLNLLMEK